ncbi:TIGR03084 family metal-binding protein [Nocardioides limicola]|uniref:TIGR03084 family metal-binding protein n=1 Tax=Nocardioides limicola TaxID=2803368 RepID=UPI00193C08A2|nr:TIGR03084 family metal-binding protein [Nocardioides sp. DJM-14]
MTNPVLAGVLADLEAETQALDDLVAPLAAAAWQTATPAEGWDIAHQVAHLAWTDEAALLAAGARTDKESWDELVLQAIADPTGFVDAGAADGAKASPADLLERWRTSRTALWKALTDYPDGEKLPWFGPPMSATSMATARFMETWAHTLDVAEGLAEAGLAEVPAPTDRIKQVANLGFRTRNFAFINAGLEPPTADIGLTLTAPSGEVWQFGPAEAEQRITGSAYHFCLRVTQRRHRDDLDLVAVGADADTWLDVAQAFAGPAGGGREPGAHVPGDDQPAQPNDLDQRKDA